MSVDVHRVMSVPPGAISTEVDGVHGAVFGTVASEARGRAFRGGRQDAGADGEG